MEVTSTPILPERTPIQSDNDDKRDYQKVTQTQIETLKNLYRIHGPNCSSDYYSQVTNIKKSRVSAMIRTLKKGGSIDKSTVKKGRQRLLGVSESTILINKIRDNNRCTLGEMQAVIEHETGKMVSKSTIHRHLTTGMQRLNLQNITLKRYVSRGSNESTIDNLKDQRKVTVRKLIEFQEKGYRTVFVDESHWQMGLVSGRARAPSGTTPVVHTSRNCSDITIIAAMADIGMLHTQIIYGSNSKEIFRTYMNHLCKAVDALKPVVFFLDNCTLHHDHDLETMVLDTGNRILFNPVYSSPLNAIEYCFGIMKKRAECTSYTNREEILTKITASFKSITPHECFKCIQHVQHSIYRRVLNGEDI